MTEERLIGIDGCHCSLIYGLVCAHKPARVLEFGYGLGNSFRAIQNGLQYNENGAVHFLVDDWSQWNGEPRDISPRHSAVELNTCTEAEYIEKVWHTDIGPFDFILSDADHGHAHETFWTVYNRMLALGGILIYHDVTNPDNPHLGQIVTHAASLRLRYAVFNRCSHPYERCERGLFVIFKP